MDGTGEYHAKLNNAGLKCERSHVFPVGCMLNVYIYIYV
jgi:hypothetical protein